MKFKMHSKSKEEFIELLVHKINNPTPLLEVSQVSEEEGRVR